MSLLTTTRLVRRVGEWMVAVVKVFDGGKGGEGGDGDGGDGGGSGGE